MFSFFCHASFLVILSGCVSSQHIVTGKQRGAIPADAVEVQPSPPAGAEEIGLVTASTAGKSQHAAQIAVDALKKQAGLLGANVLVIQSTELLAAGGGGGIGYVDAGSGFMYSSGGSSGHRTRIQARAYYAQKN